MTKKPCTRRAFSHFSSSSYVVFRQSLSPRSWEPVICWIPLSILTSVSLVISTSWSWIIRTSSVCPIPLVSRIRRIFLPIWIPDCFIFCSMVHLLKRTDTSPFSSIICTSQWLMGPESAQFRDMTFIFWIFVITGNGKQQVAALTVLSSVPWSFL